MKEGNIMKRNKKIVTLSLLTAALSIGAVVMSTNLVVNSAKAEDEYYTMTFKGNSVFDHDDSDYGNFILVGQTAKYEDQKWDFYSDMDGSFYYSDGTFTFGEKETENIFEATCSGTWKGSAYIGITFHFYGPGTFRQGYVNYSFDGVDFDHEQFVYSKDEESDYAVLYAYVGSPYGGTKLIIRDIVIEYYC